MMYLERSVYGLLLVVICIAVGGCGSGGEKLVTVTGQVLEDGNAVVVEDYYEGSSYVQISFVPLDPSSGDGSPKSYYGMLQKDGSFEMSGDMGDGIPAGKYRLAITREGDQPQVEAWDRKWGTQLDRDDSPFVFDFNDDQDGLVIDLAKPPSEGG